MSGLLVQDCNQMLDVTPTAFIDSDAAGTRLIPQQSILFTDHVALVV
jgi:hypothetical protein